MYGIAVDRASPFSLVRQLCESLRARILDGSIPSGARLPSSRALAAELGVARNVVTDAYEQLEAEGYLTGVVGSGTTVTELGARMAGRADASRRRSGGSGAARRPAAAAPAGPGRASADRFAAPAADVIDFASACGIPDLASFPYRTWRRCVVETLGDNLAWILKMREGAKGALPEPPSSQKVYTNFVR